MNIEQIRQLTKDNQIDYDKAKKAIEDSAKQGFNWCNFSSLSMEARDRLLVEGFCISINTDPFGVIVTKISWL